MGEGNPGEFACLGSCGHHIGGLAQLARAPALQAGGQRFESVILHTGLLRETGKSTMTCWKRASRKIGEARRHRVENSNQSNERTYIRTYNGTLQGRMGDALALGGEEGRDKLR